MIDIRNVHETPREIIVELTMRVPTTEGELRKAHSELRSILEQTTDDRRATAILRIIRGVGDLIDAARVSSGEMSRIVLP